MNKAEQVGSMHPAVLTEGDAPLRPVTDLIPELVEELGQLINEIRHQDFAKLEEAVETFARAPRTSSGFPTIRPADCRKLTEAFATYLRVHRTRFQQNDPVLPERFFKLFDRFAASDVRVYPNELVQLQLVRLEALILAGHNEEAIALSTPMAARPYLVEDDVSSLSKLFELDILARFNGGRRADVDAVAMGRLLFLIRAQPKATRKVFTRFFPMIATGTKLATPYPRLEGLIRFCARLRLSVRLRKKRQAMLLRVLEWPLRSIGVWTLRHLAWRKQSLCLQVFDEPAAVPPTMPSGFSSLMPGWLDFRKAGVGDILVTRAMGGLGDIMMMTPGLKALAARIGRPVHFATKRQFFPLLENNPDIRLLDIDDVIDVHRFRRWVNLSFCPAGRYESRVVPKVKKGRVEIFARAMGIRRRDLDRSGWRPAYNLSSKQLQQRDFHRAQFSAGDFPIIGIQPYSRDTYKNSPGLFKAMTELAERARIVVFHTSAVPVSVHPNIVQWHGKPIAETFAAIAACDYFVSVDSGFFHVAAAFEIPSLGIFGPTDGRVVSRHHPRALLIEAPDGFICAPCWRNEDLPCKLTGGQISVCLNNVSPEIVTAAVEQLMQTYPRPLKAASPQV